MQDLDQFRAETRDWLEANCPYSMRQPAEGHEDAYWGGRTPEIHHPDQKIWADRMGERGWTAPTWPAEYGGGGLTKVQAKILKQEMRRINARAPLMNFGLWMLGPALLKYATEEQKHTYLPDIIMGRTRWCQGYSEPGSGSDLASLQTKAEDKGDHYLVNGQKVWTSYADKADWVFCLTRTDNSGPKHAGISFLLFDMTSKGVTTKPIKLISGASPFCEMFFDDVEVPKNQLIGEEGKGWSIAKYLLTHEREMISSFGAGWEGESVSNIAVKNIGTDETGRLEDSPLRTQIAQLEIDAFAFTATLGRVMEESKSGQGIGPASSTLKYYGTELNKRRNELMVAVSGEDGLIWESRGNTPAQIAQAWLRSKANSIEGGTSEVQLNIISKRVLELPEA